MIRKKRLRRAFEYQNHAENRNFSALSPLATVFVHVVGISTHPLHIALLLADNRADFHPMQPCPVLARLSHFVDDQLEDERQDSHGPHQFRKCLLIRAASAASGHTWKCATREPGSNKKRSWEMHSHIGIPHGNSLGAQVFLSPQFSQSTALFWMCLREMKLFVVLLICFARVFFCAHSFARYWETMWNNLIKVFCHSLLCFDWAQATFTVTKILRAHSTSRTKQTKQNRNKNYVGRTILMSLIERLIRSYVRACMFACMVRGLLWRCRRMSNHRHKFDIELYTFD